MTQFPQKLLRRLSARSSVAANAKKVGGWVKNPNGEMMDGYALNECWLNA
ncbi:hypothetical protein LB535_05505 [Mesorhizobium sp. CA10]|nr:hypothetical protein [Mesorhizobium sp. CA10]MBZ9881803.1 hypothetical protein [Mesorhizobium sp. CA10]